MKFIIGLGNPGLKYRKTRHNAGFMVLDFLASDLTNSKVSWRNNKNLKSKTCQADFLNQELLLIKPQTYMNNSGQTIPLIKKKYPKFDIKDLVVIYDDIDLDFGKIRIKDDSSSGGHNGIKSLIHHLGTQEFNRIKIGVNNDLRNKIPADKFVLSHFSRDEIKEFENIFQKVSRELQSLI